MKIILVSLLGLALAPGLILSAAAQSYAMPWFTLDGGGGASSGSDYVVTGTLGQPDAAVVRGGEYIVSGGFWSTVQPPVPQLRLVPSGGALAVSWPAASAGWRLQESARLAPATWSDVATAPQVIGTENVVLVPRTGGARFYRLISP